MNPDRKDIRPSRSNDCPGQTRRETGTQSQGSQQGDRPAADRRATPQPVKGKYREGEPGALHLGAHASGIDGADNRSRNPVVLAMKTIFKAQAFRMILALMTLASSALVMEAGHRWS